MTQTLKSVLRWVFIAVVVLAAVGAAWWFTRTPASPETVAAAADPHAGMDMGAEAKPPSSVSLSPDAAKRIGVTFATVERGSLDDEVRTVGIVAYDETRVKAIAPKLDGWVEQLNVAFTGQAVEQGQPLLSIYSPMVVTAEQELLLAVKLARELGTQGDAADNAAALIVAARRRLRSWDIPDDVIARVEQTGEVLRTVTLRAPIRGVVVGLNVQAGQRVMAGDALYQVADLTNVWLEGEVFERDLALVKVGQAVAAEFEALPGQTRLGRIAYIYPTLNADTRTGRVRVELPNPGLVLKPGMYGTIRVRGVGQATTVLVPRSAVLRTGERDVVFVRMADGMLSPREVTVGAASSDQVQVLRGLNEGETVVASATFLVDAESNLGSAMGGMGNMPGMDMGDMPGMKPAASPPATPPRGSTAPAPPGGTPPTPRMPDMPGMSHD